MRKFIIGLLAVSTLVLSGCSLGTDSSDSSSSSATTNSSQKSSETDSSSQSQKESSSSSKTSSSSERINYYTITWKNYDGTVLETDKNVKEGSMPTYDGATPTRRDTDEYRYTWTGWDPAVTKVTSDQTYIATFSYEKIKKTYVIDFDLNGGTSSSYAGPKTVEAFTKDVFFFDCVKEDYNFRGWSYGNEKIFDENGTQLAVPTMSSKMTFTAIYSQTAKMKITKNIEEAGTVTGEGEYPYNTYVDVTATPNQGYDFVGWYYNGTALSNTAIYKYMMWSDDVTLEARFKLASFNLNVHANHVEHGKVIVSPNQVYLESYNLNVVYKSKVSIVAYTLGDTRFLGWYDEDNKLVATNASYSFVMPNHDYDLEAKWNYFTVTYNLNGGTNSSTNPNSYTADSGSITLSNPTKTGYDFLGWKRNDSYVSSIDPSWIDDITLDAVWQAHDYSITYNLNGGENNGSNPSSYSIESEKITFLDPTRKGYTFQGWYKDASFGTKITSIASGSHGDLNIYAKWEAIDYSITYDLNGGTNSENNPTTYTIESEYILESATKDGYTFEGWYDASGSKVSRIEKGTTGAISLTAKWNDGDEYSLTLDANGGEVSSSSVSVQYDHAYSLPDPTRAGYEFQGWYSSSTRIPSNGTWTYIISGSLKASWKIVTYSISYSLNGGKNSSSNPTSYTVEDAVTFKDPTKAGYTFEGWYDASGSKISGIDKGSIGSVDVEAKWSANKNNLTVESSDITKGTVAILSGTGYTDETIKVEATPIDDCVFMGWYSNDKFISKNATYSFTMPAGDCSLTAKFLTKAEEEEERRKALGITPVFSEDGKTVTYGLYPQKNVNDSALISVLNALDDSAKGSNGWYLYEDEYYAKLSASPYTSSYVFDNGTTIKNGTTYWFKCEPITWDILENDNGEYYLLSSVLLDAHCYYTSTSNRTINGKTVYPNNYEHSSIREWLNGVFYDAAFALGDSCIQTTTVDNSASTTNSSSNSYACNNTEDKVFLLSYKDYLKSDYGFSTSSSSSATRQCKTTDWSRARGAYCNTSSSYLYNGWYWTRSPYSDYSTYAWYVNFDGYLRNYGVYYTNGSVRPSLSLKVA